MPVNRRYPIAELLDACVYYADTTRRRVSFEWALIRGVNDSPEVADRLGLLLQPLRGRCHVNIIPLNPTGGFDGEPADGRALKAFVDVLERAHGVPATARVRRGIDIDAGCGQLTQARQRLVEREAKRQQQQCEVPGAAGAAGGAGAADLQEAAEAEAATTARLGRAATMVGGGEPPEAAVAGGWEKRY